MLALYLPSLHFPFVFDDEHNIARNPAIRMERVELAALREAAGGTYDVDARRPLAFVTFALNYRFGGLDPAGYRLTNILIHGVNALLVAAVASAMIVALRGRPPHPLVPGAAALLWAVHPVQSSAVVYVVQRATSLATLWYLAAFLAYLEARRRSSRALFALAAVLALLGCLAKEIAYVFPLLVLLWELSFNPGLRRWAGRRPLVVAAAVAVGLLLLPAAVHFFRDAYAAKGFTWQQRLLTEGRVVARYLTLLAWPEPSRLLADYRAYALSTGLLTPPATLAAAAFHAAALGGALVLLAARPVLAFPVLAFYGHLAMESTVVPLEIAYEHRLYLPSALGFAGLALAGSAAGERLRAQRTLLPVAAAALLGVAALWGAWTRERLQDWSSPVAFWGDLAAKAPGNFRAHAGLGVAYLDEGDVPRAREHLRRAIEIDGRDLRSLMNLGLAEAQLGNDRAALGYLLKTLELGYQAPPVFYNIGIVQWRLGDRRGAVEHLEKALGYDSRLPEVNYHIASIYAELGEREKARDYAARELRLNPSHREARELLSRLNGG